MKRILAVVVVAVIAAGCGDPSGGPGSADPAGDSDPAGGAKPAGSFDGAWGLTSGHDAEEEVPLVNGAPITLVIEGDSVKCRELSGEWVESGNTITFPSFSADGNCPPELEDQNSHVMNVLEASRSRSRAGPWRSGRPAARTKASSTTPTSTPRARARRSYPRQPALAGLRWTS